MRAELACTRIKTRTYIAALLAAPTPSARALAAVDMPPARSTAAADDAHSAADVVFGTDELCDAILSHLTALKDVALAAGASKACGRACARATFRVMEDALTLVKKHRAWRGGLAGRTLTLRLCDALGPGEARADKARRRLSALWFA